MIKSIHIGRSFLSQLRRFPLFVALGSSLGLAGCPENVQKCALSVDCALGDICTDGECKESPEQASRSPLLLDSAGGTFFGPSGWSIEVPRDATTESTLLTLSVLSASQPLTNLSARSAILGVDPLVSLDEEAKVSLVSNVECSGCSLWQSDDVTADFVELPTAVAGSTFSSSSFSLTFFVLAASAEDSRDGGQVDGGPTDSGDSVIDDGGQAEERDAGENMDASFRLDGGFADGGQGGSGGLDAGESDASEEFVCSDEGCSPAYCQVSLQLCVECIENEHCNSGSCDVDENRCVLSACSVDEECPAQHSCFDGECFVLPCENDDECAGGEACNVSSGKCEPLPGCVNDLQCTSPRVCDVNLEECVFPSSECSEDSECLLGFFCDIDQCRPIGECSSDGDCFNSDVCDLESFICVVPLGCVDDLECAENAFCSEQGECTVIACNDDDTCPQTLRCDELVGGFCLRFPTCENDLDCPNGQMCDQGFGVCIDA
ncbi:MAG: hypothetical protein GY822_32330 [Deltaproteobacteria bacterium]|nr:hypothetical protein [Deltaproteobacteria bacterium]